MKKTSKTISPIMRKLSAYISQALRRPIPAEVTERAKHHLLDTLSAMVSGAPLLPGRRAIDYVKALGGAREACVIGSRVVTSAVNAALANGMLAHGVTAKDVDRVVVTIDEQGAYTVSRRDMPDINIQHLVALMLVDGDITFASSHDASRVRDPAVTKLKKRIALTGSAKLSKAKTTQAVVEITMRSGERFKYHTRAVRGSATNPMSRDEVAEKSRDLLTPILGSRKTQQLIESIWTLERVKDICQLRRLLRPT